MIIVEVGALKTSVLPQHENVFAREIRGLGNGGKNVSVSHNFMLAHGGAEMHVHEESEHIFYVLKGELCVYDGSSPRIVTEGNALIVAAGELHQITGNGRVDCEYLLITSPPVMWSK